ncbi:MAG: hypothetical protein JKY53_10040 [Flavobacteriales bacterium]|nr:hypothetical protein [Flavobacteriales bacterium]
MKDTSYLKINSDLDSDSFWLNQKIPQDTIFEVMNMEDVDEREITQELLKEFVHSTNEEKRQFKQRVHSWLLEMKNESDSNLLKDEPIRDFIYEMF